MFIHTVNCNLLSFAFTFFVKVSKNYAPEGKSLASVTVIGTSRLLARNVGTCWIHNIFSHLLNLYDVIVNYLFFVLLTQMDRIQYRTRN